MAYIPLFDENGKRDKARRYIDENNPLAQPVSRRKAETLLGKLANRPSSGKHFNPQKELETTTTNKKQVPSKLSSRTPSRYSRDIDNFAKKHNMRKQDVRRDPQFKMLNKEFSQKLKQRDKLINEINFKIRKREDVSELMEKKDELTEQLGHLAREIGRKRSDDFSEFGSTI